MANRACARKALRASEKRRVRNLRVKRRVKSMIKAYKKALAQDKDKAKELLPQVFSVVDKAAKSGILHKNNAARKKSRLAKKLAAV